MGTLDAAKVRWGINTYSENFRTSSEAFLTGEILGLCLQMVDFGLKRA
jgi:hypothetical protein